VVREELLAVLQRNLPHARHRILVVDDEADSRALMRSLLEPEDHEVLCAADGREACELLGQASCDLILLDLVMPGMDGFTFLERLRANPRHAHLPVVVVTAKDLTRAEIRDLHKGASDVLQKSAAFDRDLKAVVQRLFEPAEAPPAAAPEGGGASIGSNP